MSREAETLSGVIAIEVESQPPRIVVNGLAILTAPLIDELLARLGMPTRVAGGANPAPVGHRNNQLHVYDQHGLIVHEHHFTQRAEGIWIWYEVSNPRFDFTPTSVFRGRVTFDGIEMPHGGPQSEYFAVSPFVFGGGFAGAWTHDFEGFSVLVNTNGPRSRSRRSDARQCVSSLSLSWPHDPWGKPADG